MKLWGSMKEAGELASSWTVDVGQALQLRDVIMFAFKANRTRKSQGKTAWVKAAPSGEVLLELQRAVIRFLSEGLYMYINFKYQLSHDVTKAAPARRTSTWIKQDQHASPKHMDSFRPRPSDGQKCSPSFAIL